MKVSACSKDLGCACYYAFGAVPYAGTFICSAGENMWTNYVNGYFLVQKDDGVSQVCICAETKLEKVDGGTPAAQEMNR